MTTQTVTLETEIVETVVAATLIEAVELGYQGPRGARGATGPAADIFTLTAAYPISGHRIIAVNGDGLAIYADSADASALAVQGFSANAALAGEDIEIRCLGSLDWPAANLTVDSPIFLASSGAVTQTAPTQGWSRQVGVATDVDSISINIGQAYWLGS